MTKLHEFLDHSPEEETAASEVNEISSGKSHYRCYRFRTVLLLGLNEQFGLHFEVCYILLHTCQDISGADAHAAFTHTA